MFIQPGSRGRFRRLGSFSAEPQLRFPIGLGLFSTGPQAKFPFGMGCACKPTLGQDDAVASVVVPTPTAQQLQVASTWNPLTPQELTTGVPYAGTGLNVFGVPTGASTAGLPAPPAGTPGLTSLASYLPLLVLGIGGIALVATMKRK
jgi:hypothetical protein